jgi:CHAT domain-containing protein
MKISLITSQSLRLLLGVFLLIGMPPAFAEVNTDSSQCQPQNATRVPPDLAKTYQFLRVLEAGNQARNAGNYDQAIFCYQLATQLAEESQKVDEQWLAKISLAATYQQLDNWTQALQFYQESWSLFQQHQSQFSDLSKGPSSLLFISAIYTYQKNYQKALEVLQQALTLTDTLDLGIYSDIKARLLQHLGVNLFFIGNLTEADTHLAESINLYRKVQQARVGNQTPTMMDYSDVNLIEVNRWRQQVLVAQNRYHEALELAEENRARTFASLLANRLKSNANEGIKISAPTVQQIQQIAQSKNATLVEYTVVYDFNPNSAFWVSNSEKFKANSLLIWVIKPTGEIQFRRHPITSSDLNNFVQETRNSIGARGRGLGVVARVTESRASVAPPQQNQLNQLYQLLIQPIEDLLPNDPQSQVIFIPQDALFLAPFPALQDANGTYLIEKHTILTAPSIQVLELTQKQQQQIQESIQGVVVVGNPTMPSFSDTPGSLPVQLPSLPGTEKEALAIAKLYGTQPLLGEQATKSALFQRLPNARIIHLATHGLLDDAGGFFSSIALAPTSQDNGFLTAREILSLKLNAELVVLSACNTGRGDINGDGVVGLSRSFIAAGIPSVVVSLWEVPDIPTAALLTAFYQNLKNGADKAQALRQAMLQTQKAYPDPVNWAAFTLVGEANSSKSLATAGGEMVVSNAPENFNNTSIAVNSYYTVFPVPENAFDYTETPSNRIPGEIDIYYHTPLSLAELQGFYQQVFRQKGLAENTNLTRLTNDTMQLVFQGSTNGKQLIIQAQEDYLGRGFRGVSVRFE